MYETPDKAEAFMNGQGRFFHYEPLFTSSFSKNLIIPEAVMISKIPTIQLSFFLDWFL